MYSGMVSSIRPFYFQTTPLSW